MTKMHFKNVSRTRKRGTSAEAHSRATISVQRFLPFSNDTERITFSTYVQDLSLVIVNTIDDKKDAVRWSRHFVDGINIWPKLPVHFRTYIRKWERGQRSKDLFKSCKSAETKWQNSIRSSQLLRVLIKIIPI